MKVTKKILQPLRQGCQQAGQGIDSPGYTALYFCSIKSYAVGCGAVRLCCLDFLIKARDNVLAFCHR